MIELLNDPVTSEGKTYGQPKAPYAVVRHGGKVHKITRVIVDWDKDSVTYVLACSHRNAHYMKPIPEREVTSLNACKACWRIP